MHSLQRADCSGSQRLSRSTPSWPRRSVDVRSTCVLLHCCCRAAFAVSLASNEVLKFDAPPLPSTLAFVQYLLGCHRTSSPLPRRGQVSALENRVQYRLPHRLPRTSPKPPTLTTPKRHCTDASFDHLSRSATSPPRGLSSTSLLQRLSPRASSSSWTTTSGSATSQPSQPLPGRPSELEVRTRGLRMLVTRTRRSITRE